MFQYISCYSLSKYDFWIARYPAKFQYISCYSLSFQRDHLHFQIQRFQYISCYSLSGTTRTEVSPYRSFNTSHVTLYLYSSPNNVGSSGVSIHLMLLFIAIRHWKEQHLLGFNTSHVTLYPQNRKPMKMALPCFNTSHVTLYLEEVVVALPPDSFQYISCYSLSP